MAAKKPTGPRKTTRPTVSGESAAQSRRARLASFEAERKREQRRRTVLLLGVCVVVAALLLAYPVYLFVQDARDRAATIDDLGVSAAQASCTAPEENAATGNQQHVPDGTKVDYARLPPDSGPHYNNWADFSKKFYTTSDRPAVENLVHNLEHGYTVVWYRAGLAEDQVTALQKISKTFSGGTYNQDKFIAAPWESTDGGSFPEGKNVIMTRWYANPANPADTSAQRGVREACGEVSGQAIKEFMAKYPATSAPEPNGG